MDDPATTRCKHCFDRGWTVRKSARSTGAKGYATKVKCPHCLPGLPLKRATISMPEATND